MRIPLQWSLSAIFQPELLEGLEQAFWTILPRCHIEERIPRPLELRDELYGVRDREKVGVASACRIASGGSTNFSKSAHGRFRIWNLKTASTNVTAEEGERFSEISSNLNLSHITSFTTRSKNPSHPVLRQFASRIGATHLYCIAALASDTVF